MDQKTSSDNDPKAPSKISLGGVDFPNPIIRQALVYSLIDGIFATGMISLTETYAVPAAISLNAPSMALAVLGSLPMLVGALGQLVLPHLIDPAKGRRFYVVRSAAMQSIFLAGCALSGKLPGLWGTYAFIALFVMYGASGNISNGLWMAWLRSLVPENVRGRHFAWRNRTLGIVQLAYTFAAGFFVRKFTAQNAPWTLYLTVFMLAALFRCVSSYYLSRQFEEPTRIHRMPIFAKDVSRHFILYSLSLALMQGAAGLAGPFFSVWFVRDLGFNYLTLSIAGASTAAGSILFLPLWGKLADRIGHYKVLSTAAVLVSVVPFPYVFFDQPWAIWIFNFYSGAVWSGFNIGNFSYLLLAAGKKNPDRHIAICNAILAVAGFLFGLAGGFLATRLPVLMGWQLRSLFALSGSLRCIVVLTVFRKLSRYENVSPPSARGLFAQIPGYRASLGFIRNTFRAFLKI